MERALQLSLYGGTFVSPNPFVGAVITASGRIIGEGYHRMFGTPHAEVNAIASVKAEDRPLLKEATMYVTLEPCSHFGKTPPCSNLIIDTGIPRVEVAVEDPFPKVQGSGIERMRQAGVKVEVGLCADEARHINRRFFTAHTLGRPYVLLKWAQSADGYIGGEGGTPVRLSTPYTQILMHRERAFYDAIMVGTNTLLSDNPRLDCRLWPCREPQERPLKVTFESDRLTGNSRLEKGRHVKKQRDENLLSFLNRLYSEHGITSLMVEGGAETLEYFITSGIYDEIRVETSPILLGSGTRAPRLPSRLRLHTAKENIRTYTSTE